MGGPKIAKNVFLGITPLLGADDHHLFTVEVSEAGNDRAVVRKETIAVEFTEPLENIVAVIQ